MSHAWIAWYLGCVCALSAFLFGVPKEEGKIYITLIIAAGLCAATAFFSALGTGAVK